VAKISDAINADLSRYEPLTTDVLAPKSLIVTDPRVGPNATIRCPLPPFGADVDVLRQVEKGTQVPVNRIIPLPMQTSAPPVKSTGVGASAAGSSSSSSSTALSLVAASVVINAGTLGPFASFSGSVAVTKKSFQLLSMSVNASCEVRLYGTAFAQNLDSIRLTDAPVAPEVVPNIISDVIFDTVPYLWPWQNRIAANQDTPQVGRLYVTVINPTNTILAGITVTITYLPLES
jgi:hypothetical protein